MKIGIVGNGFVGNAIYQNLKDKVETLVYDVIEEKKLNDLNDVIDSDIVFICLPTPMKNNGECDLSYIDSFFKNLSPKLDPLFVIKSTVPIGTTERLSRFRDDLKIVHNPEFLTAINAVEDFSSSNRNIIGGSQRLCLELKLFYEKYFPHMKTQIVKSKESETIKYFCNSFLATKVALFNNLYQICKELHLNYDSVRDGVVSDSRIGNSHTKVPGPDGAFGFGGYCFPKDINALIKTLKENNIDDTIFNSVWEYNKKIRNEI